LGSVAEDEPEEDAAGEGGLREVCGERAVLVDGRVEDRRDGYGTAYLAG